MSTQPSGPGSRLQLCLQQHTRLTEEQRRKKGGGQRFYPKLPEEVSELNMGLLVFSGRLGRGRGREKGREGMEGEGRRQRCVR